MTAPAFCFFASLSTTLASASLSLGTVLCEALLSAALSAALSRLLATAISEARLASDNWGISDFGLAAEDGSITERGGVLTRVSSLKSNVAGHSPN